jgi:hypothetical protein
MDSVEARVARGAAVMDCFAPGWELVMDLGDLDMADCHVCILGQRFGSYTAGLDELELFRPDDFDFDKGVDWQVDCGFDVHGNAAQYVELTDAWGKLIKDRLNVGIAL